MPGFVRHPQERPYPTNDVVITCSVITGELILLFAILKPFCLSLRRTLIALLVFTLLLMADFVLFSGWTDQPGYAYSNSFFLLLVVGFLAAAAVWFKLAAGFQR